MQINRLRHSLTHNVAAKTKDKISSFCGDPTKTLIWPEYFLPLLGNITQILYKQAHDAASVLCEIKICKSTRSNVS